MLPDYGAADFAAEFDVPRGTMDSLRQYAAMLVDWQNRMNLVGPATLPDLWSRHMRDSAQIVRLGQGEPGRVWLDIGSGAGFPALVVALLTDASLHLVESTAKKCAFLGAVVAECGIGNATIYNARIETLPSFDAAIISARACASLTQLFAWGARFATPETRWLLPKGTRHAEEIADAEASIRFSYGLHSSLTDSDARIVEAKLHMRDEC